MNHLFSKKGEFPVPFLLPSPAYIMIIGIRESSGKEFTINLNDLYRAYQECLRFTSPEVKKYIFMGHSPAVALLRMLQKHETY